MSLLDIKRLALAATAAFLCLSCSAPQVRGFPWKSSEGKSIAFAQTEGLAEGSEGSLEPGHPRNRFLPEPALSAAPGEALELELELDPSVKESRLSVALSSGRVGEKPFFEGELLLRDPRTRYAIPLPEKSRLASLQVGLLPLSEGGKDLAPARLASVAVVPAFRGIELGKEGPRLSSGLSVYRKGGEGVISVERPFEGMIPAEKGSARRGAAAFLLSYGPGCRGFTLEADGARLFSVRAKAKGGRVVLPAALFPAGAARVDLVYPVGEALPDFYASSLDPRDAELADLGRVLKTPPSGADYELYRWDLIPSVLIFDFKDYATQDAYLKRLAFFVEKAGFKGRLAEDTAIAGLHGWNAHDYRSEDLAAFFEAVRKSSFKLDPQEEELRTILMDRGLIREREGKIAAGEGAIVSITRESQGYLRSLFLTHETTHAIFFTDPDYRAFVRQTWASVPAAEKWFWLAYFRWMVYDTSDSYLMANEYQAYLLQQPVTLVEAYFTKNLASRLAEKHPELKDQIDAYMKAYGPSFALRAKALEDWLSAKYGFYAGRGNFIQ